jgi:hypothetical protein
MDSGIFQTVSIFIEKRVKLGFKIPTREKVGLDSLFFIAAYSRFTFSKPV